MQVKLDLDILPQPNGETCGPTCLHAVYQYYGDPVPLKQIIEEVPSLSTGGTLAVLLACHALQRGYKATIFAYTLNLFDPTWFNSSSVNLRQKLRAQARFKKAKKFRHVTDAYLNFLDLGGTLRFEDLTKRLIRKYLDRSIPILTGLSATYLYHCPREFGPKMDYNDIRGVPTGHFVILSGYNKLDRTVHVSDPLHPNPVSKTQKYQVNIDRVIGAILLGIVTYDANLLILQPKEEKP